MALSVQPAKAGRFKPLYSTPDSGFDADVIPRKDWLPWKKRPKPPKNDSRDRKWHRNPAYRRRFVPGRGWVLVDTRGRVL